MKHKLLNVKGIVSCIFAFLLTISFTVLFLCTGFGLGVFNNTNIIRNLNESRYYYKVQEALEISTQTAVSAVDLPAEVLTDVITPERVYIGGKNYVEAALSGKKAKINTERLHADLSRNINQYLTKQRIEHTDELDQAIDTFIASIETEYKNGIQLQFVNNFTGYREKYMTLIKFLYPILFILIGVLCFLLIRMHHYKHRGIRYIVYALLSSSLMTLAAAAYLLLIKSYEKIDINPAYYHDFLSVYLKGDITVFIYIGSIGILISFVLISFVSYLKNKIIEH